MTQTIQPLCGFLNVLKPPGMSSAHVVGAVRRMLGGAKVGHAGTLDDPIPYDGNMELTEGLYYIQDEIVYLCTRSSGQPVYHALSALVGLYVEVA